MLAAMSLLLFYFVFFKQKTAYERRISDWSSDVFSSDLPKMQVSDNRLLIIGHLAQSLPAREAGAEVSLAIAGVAADSLSSMIPGLLGAGQAQGIALKTGI